MIDLSRLHEKETFSLHFSAQTGGDVISHLTSHGAQQEDDFFYLPYDSDPKPWQSSSIWVTDCFFNNRRVSPNESLVNRVDIDYLFSSTPIDNFRALHKIIESSVSRFQAVIFHAGSQVTVEAVLELRDLWLADLDSELAEKPGSESLAILIQDLFYQ